MSYIYRDINTSEKLQNIYSSSFYESCYSNLGSDLDKADLDTIRGLQHNIWRHLLAHIFKTTTKRPLYLPHFSPALPPSISSMWSTSLSNFWKILTNVYPISVNANCCPTVRRQYKQVIISFGFMQNLTQHTDTYSWSTVEWNVLPVLWLPCLPSLWRPRVWVGRQIRPALHHQS